MIWKRPRNPYFWGSPGGSPGGPRGAPGGPPGGPGRGAPARENFRGAGGPRPGGPGGSPEGVPREVPRGYRLGPVWDPVWGRPRCSLWLGGDHDAGARVTERIRLGPVCHPSHACGEVGSRDLSSTLRGDPPGDLRSRGALSGHC